MSRRASAEPATAELNPRWWWILPIGITTGLLSGTFSYFIQRWISPSIVERPLGQYGWVAGYNVLAWTTLAGLVPAALWLARAVPFVRGRILVASIVHVAGAMAFSLTQCVLAGTIRYGIIHVSGQAALTPDLGTWTNAVTRVLLFGFEWQVLLYGGIVAASQVVRLYQELQARQLHESRLEARLVEARLQALQRQLQPHFLFNTLHAVAGLLHRDPDAAEAMIVRLSDLLRVVFRADLQQEVPLARELTLTCQYIEIQRVRFGDSLRIAIDVPADARAIPVPVLILQPLVENAIKHGFAGRPEGGTIRITGRRAGNRLELRVADDGRGVGLEAVRELNEGVGLSNTRARLEHLYRDQYAMHFDAHPGRGFSIALQLPWRTAAAAETTIEPIDVAA
jgi:hypothetical protein